MNVAVFIKALLFMIFMKNNYAFAQSQPMENKLEGGFLAELMSSQPDRFQHILSKKDELKVQIIYTTIDRKKSGKPVFTDHFFNTDTTYYYPASTVKLPIAILALQKLNELNISGLDKNSTMITDAAAPGQTAISNDPSAGDGRPTIAHYIKKILLVSDNDASNRLYEFLGQEYINQTLHRMGYTDVEIVHRLAISLSEEQNRTTNPIRFLDTSGKILYEKPLVKSNWQYATRDTRIGKGFMRGNTLINEPFDFSQKNRMSLQTLHSILRSVIFPESLPKEKRFNLKKEDYEFLRRYMSMRPGESDFPKYDSSDFWNNYAKIIFFGIEKAEPPAQIRIFSKSGWSYGFLTDATYIVDLENKIEFMLTATIYCNSDGILNDDKYDYKTLGYPFMKNIGELLYDYELKRTRKVKPDLSDFRYQY